MVLRLLNIIPSVMWNGVTTKASDSLAFRILPRKVRLALRKGAYVM
jgi:hypothetical protein